MKTTKVHLEVDWTGTEYFCQIMEADNGYGLDSVTADTRRGALAKGRARAKQYGEVVSTN